MFLPSHHRISRILRSDGGSQRGFRRALSFVGIDDAVGSALLWRGLAAVAGVATLKAVATWLTPAEQGFYFTFGSVVGIRIFCDLSFSYVIGIMVSHEVAHLSWGHDGLLRGNPQCRRRLGGLLRIAGAWYIAGGALLLAATLCLGTRFFGHSEPLASGVHWRTPWLLLSVTASIAFVLTPYYAFLEGCGLVAKVARLRAGEVLASNTLLCIAFASGAELYSVAAVPLVQVIYEAAVLWRRRVFFLDIWRAGEGGSLWALVAEVWPFQWRIATSAAGGYFISTVLNPIVFTRLGPEKAGQFGMSLAVVFAVTTVASTWVNTKSPLFGMLVSQRQYASLDEVFWRSLLRGGAFMVGALAGLVVVLEVLLGRGYGLAARVVGPASFVALSLVALANFAVFAEAVYLRAHKRDPFVFASLAGGALVASSGWFAAGRFGVPGVCAAYLAVAFVSSAYCSALFFKKRSEWHRQPLPEELVHYEVALH